MTALWIGLAVYLLGSAADVYTTKRAVADNPAKFHEGNQFMAPVMERFGWIGLAGIKVIPLAVLVCVGIFADMALQSGVGLAVLGAWFGYVAVLNRRLIRRLR